MSCRFLVSCLALSFVFACLLSCLLSLVSPLVSVSVVVIVIVMVMLRVRVRVRVGFVLLFLEGQDRHESYTGNECIVKK